MSQTIQTVGVNYKTATENIFRFTILSIISLLISIVTLAVMSICVFETLTLRQYTKEYEIANGEKEFATLIVTKRYFADITNLDTYQNKIGILPIFKSDKSKELIEELDKEVKTAIDKYYENVKIEKESNKLNSDFVKTIEQNYGVKIQLSTPRLKNNDRLDKSNTEIPSFLKSHDSYFFTFLLTILLSFVALEFIFRLVFIVLKFLFGPILPNKISNKKSIDKFMDEIIGFFQLGIFLLILFKLFLMFDEIYSSIIKLIT